jgi:hypothetical protein
MPARQFPAGYSFEWIASMLVGEPEPETMNVTILNAPQTLSIDMGRGRIDDIIVVAAIALPDGLLTTLALDIDGDYLAMPAVDTRGSMTAWEPVGTDAPTPPPDEGPMDKMHRLGRWLASHYLNARQTFDRDAKV